MSINMQFYLVLLGRHLSVERLVNNSQIDTYKFRKVTKLNFRYSKFKQNQTFANECKTELKKFCIYLYLKTIQQFKNQINEANNFFLLSPRNFEFNLFEM